MKTHTRGNVIIEDIKLGDIHYEYEYNCCIKSTVTTLPEKDKFGNWVWQSKTDSGGVIDYSVNPDYPHVAPKLYDHEEFHGIKIIS